MRICVVGNSHVAALKRAWNTIRQEHSGIELTFFAMGSTYMAGLVVDNKRLVANNDKLKAALAFTSGGLSAIDPEYYDLFLVYGMNAKPSFIQNDIFYSSAVRRQALRDLVEETLSFKTILKLRQVTDKKLYIGHNPLRALEKISEKDRTADYEAGISALNNEIFSELNCELVPQPLTTLIRGAATDVKFTIGSRKLAAGTVGDNQLHQDEDNFHMNDEFGKIWLKDFFRKLP
jgi:hypothetical protein